MFNHKTSFSLYIILLAIISSQWNSTCAADETLPLQYNATTSRPNLAQSPADLVNRFNAESKRSGLTYKMVNTSRVRTILRATISPAITATGIADLESGILRSLLLTFDDSKSNNREEFQNFVAVISCLFEVLDPSLGIQKQELLMQLGLSPQNSPLRMARANTATYRFLATTSGSGRTTLHIYPQYNSSRPITDSNQINDSHASPQRISGLNSVSTNSPTINQNQNLQQESFAPFQNVAGTQMNQTEVPFQESNEQEPGNKSQITQSSPTTRRYANSSNTHRRTAHTNIPLAALSRLGSLPSIPGIGAIPYAGAARGVIRSVSQAAIRSSQDSNDPYRPRIQKPAQNTSETKDSFSSPINNPAVVSNTFPPLAPSVVRPQKETTPTTSTTSFGYLEYCIGMPLEEFLELPLPNPNTTLLTKDSTNGATPKVIYSFKNAGFDLGPCHWNPTFSFHKTQSGFKLTEIRGDIGAADIPYVADSFTSKYGQPNIKTTNLCRWDNPNGLTRVCTSLGREVGEVCFEDKNFSLYESNTTEIVPQQKENIARISRPSQLPSRFMNGWHQLTPFPGFTLQRWQELQAFVLENCRDLNYCPKVGDTCFIGMNDMGWLTKSAKTKWTSINLRDRQAHDNDYSPTKNTLFSNAAAQSAGTLIWLQPGIKVQVLEGKWERPSFVNGGKLKILTGIHAGKTCFSDGITLQRRHPNSSKINNFCKTPSEKEAVQAIMISRSLSRNGDISLNSEELRLNMLLEK